VVVRAGRRRAAVRRSRPCHASIEDAQCTLDGAPSCEGVLRLRRCQRDVDVFKNGTWSDAEKPRRRLDEVVAREAGVFAAESVGEGERFNELTSVHEKTRAVDGP